MNKVLHALVYLILALAGAALFFEMSLFDKRALLGDRNRQLEDFIVRIAATIEKADLPKPSTLPEASRDKSPVEAKLVETPEMENLLEDYPAQLEGANAETFNWDNSGDRVQLRQLYYVENGEKVPDAANPGDFMKKGKGTASELLDQLFERAKMQQSKLNSTRAALVDVRQRVESLAAEYNKLKPPARQDKITIEEQKVKMEELEKARQAAVDEKNKIKSQIDDLNSEVTSLKDEVSSAKDETEGVREELAKSQKLVDQLKKLLQRQASQPAAATGGATAAVTSLTAGDKGRIVDVNNELMFAIIEFTDEAMKELLGPERQGALPQLELGIRRKGATPAGDFVGRVRLRQAVAGKNFVVADLLGDWQQTPVVKNDAVFAQ